MWWWISSFRFHQDQEPFWAFIEEGSQSVRSSYPLRRSRTFLLQTCSMEPRWLVTRFIDWRRQVVFYSSRRFPVFFVIRGGEVVIDAAERLFRLFGLAENDSQLLVESDSVA